MYAKFVCDYLTLKSESFRFRSTVGSDRLEYTDDAASPAESLLESKLLFNSTLSDAHRAARFLSCDLKVCFLETPMSIAEYMRIHSKYFPP